MRALLRGILLASLSIAASPSAGADPGVDAFVVAGQSNALGWSTQNEDSTVGRVTSPSAAGLVSMSFRIHDHRWTLANEFPCADAQCVGTNCAMGSPNRTTALHPQRTDTGNGTCVCDCGVHTPSASGDSPRGSAWPNFARRWMNERGRELRLVATARANTTLVASPTTAQPGWDPDAYDCAALPPVGVGVALPAPTQPGELYCRMLEAVDLAGLDRIRAVLWMQGETDSLSAVPGPTYRAALEHLADRIWEDLGVPMIVAPIGTYARPGDACVASTARLAIDTATREAIAAHPHILPGPSPDDLELEPGCTHVHDVATLGNRWYDAVAAALPACDDGLDDDGDGFTDFPADPGCATPTSPRENPACQDGIDQDGDGKIDFDGGAAANGGVQLAPPDPQCVAFTGATERAGMGCGLGAELALVVALLRRATRRR